MPQKLTRLLIIAGPTASGKTEISVRAAKALDAEIIVADSMQVYRYLNIGTAKPSSEEMGGIQHHLIDILEPNQIFSAGAFSEEASKIIEDIVSRGKIPIVSGGTGLYIKALLHGLAKSLPVDNEIREQIKLELFQNGLESLYEELKTVDPETASKLFPSDKQRITRALEVYRTSGIPISQIQKKHGFKNKRYNYLFFSLRRDRKELAERIDERADKMFKNGLIDETMTLLSNFEGKDINALRAIGYREVAQYLDGKLNLAEAISLVKKSTRDYAKRQMTWLRTQHDVIWVDVKQNEEHQTVELIIKKASKFFK